MLWPTGPGGGWIYLTPRDGWRAWVLDESADVVWAGSDWLAVTGATGFDQLGINAGADASNRLAVASDAVLLTHNGAGHQLKVNKASALDTASLLFQDDWSGRAEMGLAGSDAWSIKVSADGMNWTTAIEIDPATGQAIGAAVQTDETDDTAGRMMKVGAFGLGSAAVGVTPTDLDTLDAGGLYQTTVASTLEANASVLHIPSATTRAAQLGFESDGGGLSWRRKSSGQWEDWDSIVTSGGLLGVVSENGGVPTGAVIESGTNANGTYTRFADGTQICHHKVTEVDINISVAGLFKSDSQDWTFPAAFINGDWTAGGRVINSASGIAVHVRGSQPTESASIHAYSVTSLTNRQVSFFALGRWL